MYNFIKTLFIIIFCFTISSCGNDKEYKKEDTEYKTDTYTINSENIIFSKDENFTLNTDIKQDTDNWILDFETRVSDNKIKENTLPNMQIKHKIYKINEYVISMVTTKYAYISGIHGNTWWKARNFDIKNNAYLSLKDLFYDDEYIKTLNNAMNDLVKENPEKYHDLWEKPEIAEKNLNNFYLDNKSLVIFFQPYELSYYAKGVVEFPIEVTKLRGYIKEEYLKILS